jgi:benzoylformate decarboxylase
MPSDFQYVLGLHERVAACMALGYAMGRNEAAFVNLHSIASVGNGLSAIIDAYQCQAPLVITTGQQDRRQILAEPFLVSRAVEVVKPYVKWAYEPLRPEDVPAAIARGYHLAMQPPRGPVFISIPMDDWNKPCQPVVARRVTQSVSPEPAALDEVARAIDASRKLALITGAQIEQDGAWNGVIALAERRFREAIACFAAACCPRRSRSRISSPATTRWSFWARRCSSTTRLSPEIRFGPARNFSRSRIRRATQPRHLPGQASSETSR